MKRFFTLIMISSFAFSFILLQNPSKTYAYTGGLLNGKAGHIAGDSVSTGTTTGLVTDNNESTNITLGISGSTTDTLWIDIGSEKVIKQIKMKTGGTLKTSLINNAGVVVWSDVADYSAGLTKNISNVTTRKLVVENTGNTNIIVSEADLFEYIPPDTAAPANVTNLLASNISYTTATINFTTPSTADFNRYKIYKNGTLVFTSASGIAKSSPFSYSAIGLVQSTVYNFKVTTLDVTGNESAGTTINFTTLAPTPTPTPKPTPNDPTGLTATAGNTMVSLDWVAVGNANNYKIYQNGSLLDTTTTKPYLVKGLTNGTTYKYEVSAVNEGGESGKSIAVTATPTLPPPTGLIGIAGNTTASLDWNDVGSATKYKIYQDGILLTTTATKPYLINGLTNGTIYSYQVSAVSGSVESAKTNVVTVKPDNPAVPSGFKAIAGNKEISLDWNLVANATSYKIYQDGSYLTTVTNKPYLITGLTNGTVYSFEITAINAIGESEKSAAITSSPIDSLPPTGLSSNVSDSKINVSWNPVNAPPATKYRLYRDGVLLSELVGVTYSDTVVTNGTTYKYEVSAVNNSGESAKSAAIFAKPSKDISDFTKNVLPFSVLDMLKTTVNFLMMYGLWIVLALAVLFSPFLYRLAIKLVNPKKENEESDKAYTREELKKMIKEKGYKISKRAEEKIYRDGRKAQRNAERASEPKRGGLQTWEGKNGVNYIGASENWIKEQAREQREHRERTRERIDRESRERIERESRERREGRKT
jgi:hypothetical protein